MSTLIFIPGLLSDAALWHHQSDGLSDIAKILVADVTKSQSMADMADAVLALAPGQFALAGHSMGGYVAFEIMRRAPSRVSRLALIATTARPDTPEQRRRRRGLIHLAQTGRFKGVTPRLLRALVHPDNQDDEVIAATVAAMTARVGRDAFLRQQQAIAARPDSRNGLPMILCPTVIVAGRQDPLCPMPVQEEMAAAIPRSRLVIIEGAGHLVPLEQGAAVTDVLRFWLSDGLKEERTRDWSLVLPIF